MSPCYADCGTTIALTLLDFPRDEHCRRFAHEAQLTITHNLATLDYVPLWRVKSAGPARTLRVLSS